MIPDFYYEKPQINLRIAQATDSRKALPPHKQTPKMIEQIYQIRRRLGGSLPIFSVLKPSIRMPHMKMKELIADPVTNIRAFEQLAQSFSIDLGFYRTLLEKNFQGNIDTVSEEV